MNVERGVYAVISKAGFTMKAEEFAKENDVMLFELKDMEQYFIYERVDVPYGGVHM